MNSKGAILNNSRRNTQTQLGGWIQGNPFLATGEARVIVNQVNSANPSLLNGYIEVGGQRAEVVLANPAGIQVNGGGFINASSATLTTGTPFIRSGQVDKYLVRDGQISIKGKGLDAKDTDFTRILSRYVDADAPVFANDLQVLAGSNDVAVDGSVSAQKVTANPNRAVAIDTGELGGMYAHKITLISTENNQRIDNKGQIFAQAGDVVLDSQGNLQNAGTIASQGTANIQVKDVVNSGTLSAKEQFDIRAQSLDNSGTVLASGEWNAQLDNQLVNTGAIQSARLDIRTRQLDNAGEISQTGLQGLAIENTGTFSNPEADTTSANNGLSNSGTSSANNSSTTAPTTATGSGSSTALPTFADGRIQTSQSLNNAGTIQANGGIDLTAKNGLSNAGELNIKTLTVSGDTLDNQKGKLSAQTAKYSDSNFV